jgi:hypothetical protein
VHGNLIFFLKKSDGCQDFGSRRSGIRSCHSAPILDQPPRDSLIAQQESAFSHVVNLQYLYPKMEEEKKSASPEERFTR